LVCVLRRAPDVEWRYAVVDDFDVLKIPHLPPWFASFRWNLLSTAKAALALGRPVYSHWIETDPGVMVLTEAWMASLPSDRWRSQIRAAPCAICFEADADLIVCHRACQHVFCAACWRGWMDRSRTCPCCRGAPDDPLLRVARSPGGGHGATTAEGAVRRLLETPRPPNEKWLLFAQRPLCAPGLRWIGFTACSEADATTLDEFRTPASSVSIVGLHPGLPTLSMELGVITHVVTVFPMTLNLPWLVERLHGPVHVPLHWHVICG
jgi:hypothetical protein